MIEREWGRLSGLFNQAVLSHPLHARSGNGYHFYQADNGVWLTDHLPPSYLVLSTDLSH